MKNDDNLKSSASSTRESPSENLVEGRLSRIVYESDDGRFVVARMVKDGSDFETTIIGHLGGLIPGEKVRVRGQWKEHPKFGRQLEVKKVESVEPPSTEGLRKYLESGAIQGVGSATAQKLVDHFGESLIEVLDHHPEKLDEIEGLSSSRVDMIREGWKSRRETRDIYVFLHGHGLGMGMASRVYRAYGGGTVEVVKKNPYRLAKEISGFGFIRSDGIARSLGWELDKPERIRAALHHVLDQASLQGHICLPLKELVESSESFLKIDGMKIRQELQEEINQRELIAESTPSQEIVCYRPHQHDAEKEFVDRVGSLRDREPMLEGLHPSMADQAVQRAQQESELELSDGQREALIGALRHKVAVLTGGPGVGKTTIIRLLVSILRTHDVPFCLAAPTGRAAKRLASASLAKASTIHRLLYFDPETGEFQYGSSKKLKKKFVIVDEVSMMDMGIALALLRAIDENASLLMVGDANQLPSVGPGNVLRDIIDSGAVAVFRLNAIFRQSKDNPIVDAAHAILRGDVPEFQVIDDKGIAFIEVEPDRMVPRMVKLVAHQLPERLKLNAESIQVLSPMIRAPSGTAALNQALQQALNQSSQRPSIKVRGKPLSFAPGDRVMQTRNNYSLNVFNGDLGEVISVVSTDENKVEVTVRFDEGPVKFPEENLDEILLAYAITIHRSQGSEFPVVVIPLTTQHRIMLKRNLIYTAVTRARALVVLVGDRKALEISVADDRLADRHTGLAWRLSRLGPHDDPAPPSPTV